MCLCEEGWQMQCFWLQGMFCLPQYSEESLWQASLQKCSWWKAKDVACRCSLITSKTDWCYLWTREKEDFVHPKLLNRFLHDKDGPVQSFRIKCLKPKCGSDNVLEDTPKHLPDDIDNFCLSDIIAGPWLSSQGAHKSLKYQTMRKRSNFSMNQARLSKAF